MRHLLTTLFVLAAATIASAEIARSAEPAEAIKPVASTQPGRTHTVQPGETLWQIAAHTVGDPTLWPALYLANRDQIKDPSRVYPGQRLAIPKIDPEKAEELRREGGELNTQ